MCVPPSIVAVVVIVVVVVDRMERTTGRAVVMSRLIFLGGETAFFEGGGRGKDEDYPFALAPHSEKATKKVFMSDARYATH